MKRLILTLALASSPLLGQTTASPPAATNAGIAPVPLGEPERWILRPDYPEDAPAGAEGFVEYTLAVAPDGTVAGCSGEDAMAETPTSSRFTALTCQLLGQRARFAPARDGGGVAVVGSFRGIAPWSRDEFGGGRMITHPIIVRPAPPPSAAPPPPRLVARSARIKGNPGSWVTAADYPTAALRSRISGIVAFRLAIGPDGRASDCTIVHSSGSAPLDEATCAQIRRRARFAPATDDTGQPVSGTYASRVHWRLPSLPAKPIRFVENGGEPVTLMFGERWAGREATCVAMSPNRLVRLFSAEICAAYRKAVPTPGAGGSVTLQVAMD